MDLINGVLGSLVSITAGCFLYNGWEALLIGAIGAFLACITMPLFDKMGVDDPVGASSVHGVCGIWGNILVFYVNEPQVKNNTFVGVVAVGLFADNPVPLETTSGRSGLFKGGGWYLLGIQSLSALCLTCWGVCSTFLLLWMIDKIIPVRMDPNEEILGADLMEHRIRHAQIGLTRAISALAPVSIDLKEITGINHIGVNPGHDKIVEKIHEAEDKISYWHAFYDKSALKVKEDAKKGKQDRNVMKRAKSKLVNNLKIGNLNGTYSKKGEIPTTKDSQDDGPAFAWVD